MYGGTTPLRVLLRIYAHGSVKAMRGTRNIGITIHTAIGKHAGDLKTSRRSISDAFSQLEKDKFIERLEQGRSETHDHAGEFRSAHISLLYPGKNWTLRSTVTDQRDAFGVPQGILTANDYAGGIIIVPYDFLKKLNKLPDACSRAALLGALRECTDAGNESVLLSPQQWQEHSHLSRSDLYRGKRVLIDRKLLSYRRGILTMHDPKTLKPTERWKRRDTATYWSPEQTARYEYIVNRTAEDTFRVLKAAFPDMGLREVESKSYKWIGEKKCPFCHEATLYVHLHKRIFRCVKGSCSRRGKIYKKLLGDGLRLPFKDVVAYCKSVLERPAIEQEKLAA